MKRYLIVLGLVAGLAGCDAPFLAKRPADPVGAGPTEAGPTEAGPTEAGPQIKAAPLVVAGQTAATLDRTTEAEQAAALAQPGAASETDLGPMVVALGSPVEQGFWLSGGAITAPGKGRVVTAGGASVAVDLRPGTGGALLSLAAFRALGLGLTDLPELRVFANAR